MAQNQNLPDQQLKGAVNQRTNPQAPVVNTDYYVLDQKSGLAGAGQRLTADQWRTQYGHDIHNPAHRDFFVLSTQPDGPSAPGQGQSVRTQTFINRPKS